MLFGDRTYHVDYSFCNHKSSVLIDAPSEGMARSVFWHNHHSSCQILDVQLNEEWIKKKASQWAEKTFENVFEKFKK